MFFARKSRSRCHHSSLQAVTTEETPAHSPTSAASSLAEHPRGQHLRNMRAARRHNTEAI
eukprot:4250439-Karenia_brevis.AAC.1